MTEIHPAALILARRLIGIRRRLAPPGSIRERLIRLLYLPLIRWAQRGELIGDTTEPNVLTVPNLRAKALAWPIHPKILVLKLDHLGDFVVALRAFHRLRQAFPQAVITLLCGSWNRAWAERSALFDAIVTFDFFATTKAEWRGATAEHFARFSRLDLGSFELAIDLRHDPDTRPLLALIDADVRAGFCAPFDLGGGILDLALPDMEHISPSNGTGRPVHADLRLLLLVTAVTATFVPTTHPVHNLVATKYSCGTSRPYAILAPGAGSPVRVWPIERLAEVGRALIDGYDLDVLLIGAVAQSEDCAIIASLLPEDRVFNLAGRISIADLPDVVKCASILVGNDTGTSHLSASLDVPTVAVMGGIATSETWRVDGPMASSIASEIVCSACYLTYATECPFAVRCITAISVEHVLAACEAHLGPPVNCTRTKQSGPSLS